MRSIAITFFIFFANICLAQENLTFAEGDTWTQPAIGKVWVEDGATVQVSPEGGQYLFRALKPGQSEIHIGKKTLWVSVLTRQQNRTWELLKTNIERTLGLELKTVEGSIQVTGHLYRSEDWETLAGVCRNRKCIYKMAATIDARLQSEIQTEFEKKLRKISAFPYRLEFSDRVTLHLPLQFPQTEKVSELLDRYGIEIIKDASSLELHPLVKVQITVAEIKRSEAVTYGIKWQDAYNAQLLPSTGNIDPISISLQAMEKNGVGKVLASPNLLCRSGKEAEFLAGGEFPIKIINFKLQDIVWKKYGILLRVKPVADFSGRMSISLETEVSSLDNSHKVDGIPGVYINRLQSHFDLTSPQTIALSGLLKRETGENSEGLPGLSNIPILGALFASKDYMDNKTELVILVRPEIVQQRSEP